MQKIKKYKIIAVVIAVIIIPLVYSFFYLDAFWDPYNKLDKLPVAVVNQDNGATINGETRNLGKEITDNIKSDNTLDWVVTSDSDAKDGVENRRYYASIYIPNDFSKKIASAGNSEKVQGNIIYNVNEKRNYLASQVLSRVTLEFKDKISKDVSKEIVGQLVSQIKDLPSSLKTLDDGLKRINDGTTTIYDKTGELVSGQEKFNDGLSKLSNGLLTANEGSNTLSAGASKVSDGASLFSKSFSDSSKDITKLTAGSTTFSTGLSTVNDGLSKLNTGVSQLSQATSDLDKNMSTYNTGVQSFTTGLNTYVESVNKASDAQVALAKYIESYTASHPEALKDPSMQAILKTIEATKSAPAQVKTAGTNLVTANKSLAEATAKFAVGTTQLNTSVNTLSQNSTLISNGTNKLNESYSQIDKAIQQVNGSISTASKKSTELAKGASAVKTGIDELGTGIEKASAGSQELSDNATKIYDGETKLLSGLGELKDGMSEASQGVSSSLLKADNKLGGTEGLKEYVSEPVKISENKINPITNYGTAFSPYFISLSLFVGALIMFITIYLDPEIKFRKLSNKSRGILRFAGYSLVSIAQAVILDIVLINALHLDVKNLGLFFLVSIIVALAFTSIMRFLIVHLSEVGKFLAILLLIFQLTSCGALFPMELIPDFFKAVNPFMPMTYSVNALKEVISGVDYGFLSQNVIVLVLIAVVFSILNLSISKIKNGKLLADSKDSEKSVEEVCAGM